MTALVKSACQIARLQMKDVDSGPAGATPEQLNVVLAEVMNDLKDERCA